MKHVAIMFKPEMLEQILTGQKTQIRSSIMSTKINYCDETWNIVTGCTPISPGCARCYAKKMAQRLKGRYGYPKDEPFRATFHPDKLSQPLHWKKHRRIFVSSMGDLHGAGVSFEWIDAAYAIITLSPRHTFLVLTKRPKRMRAYWSKVVACHISHAALHMPFLWKNPDDITDLINAVMENGDSLRNLWLGTSCENQEYADKRIPHLLKIPAAVRWLSLEPLLGPIDLIGDLSGGLRCDQCGYTNRDAGIHMDHSICTNKYGGHGWANWVVIGCESGQGRRPCKIEWVHSIVEQCQAANVPVWVKQIEIDGKVETDMAKFPEELQVRELPK